MKEFNWRENREKFRVDFQKTETAAPAADASVQNNNKRSFSILCAVLGIILIGIAAATVSMLKKDSSSRLAEMAEKHKFAVGIATVTFELNNGKKVTFPIGTAWAFSENRFATNGHVANAIKSELQQFILSGMNTLLLEEAKKHGCKSVKEYLEKLGSNADSIVALTEKRVRSMIKDARADIIINGTKRKSYSVTHVQIHKDYGVAGTKFTPDVAVLTIREKHDSYFKLADKDVLYALKSGEPVAFLGFPIEHLDNDNVNLDNPIASMQSGIVVAVSDFDMKDVGETGNFMLRHNLPATGGASGSPIFNRNGEVVALLYGGNVIGQVSVAGKVVRSPSAAQINFGARVDLLSGLGEKIAIKKFMNF